RRPDVCAPLTCGERMSSSRVHRSLLDRLLMVVVAAFIVGLAAIFADALARDGWHGVSKTKHALAGIALYTPVAACVGLVLGLLAVLVGRLERRTRARWPRL